ncbi:hypothetical protein Esi_0076_0037 [Ectocarpus siliculosus]|uniref:Uncharacterized protein n=1 Tax=Ectocarpus siliculosus TaxID=2880 RepID=D8LSP9_ECTSI|nr:hypothetical protein Esi_0076_0037 [Ectocarpus siliculosus]|eukprot:CBN75249.1 hypothetical protein Esi_0076_0037 [Ectocarpus siliculosus]
MPRDRASHRCMPPRRSIASACSRSSESWKPSKRSRREGRRSAGENRNWRFGRSSERRRSSARAAEGVKVPPCRPLPAKGRREGETQTVRTRGGWVLLSGPRLRKAARQGASSAVPLPPPGPRHRGR